MTGVSLDGELLRGTAKNSLRAERDLTFLFAFSTDIQHGSRSIQIQEIDRVHAMEVEEEENSPSSKEEKKDACPRQVSWIEIH